ncbi:hypothetical protein DMP23_42865 [Amycolatopsis sp. A1MSW2902]|uniref:hypothetical protein n=1 Tax=Amycolatopsis sp. A1MSW2902 TaxID=687413 RepID=UPI00307DDD26
MVVSTAKVSLAQWLDGISGACSDQQFSEVERKHLEKARDDKMVLGGYLMGISDNANTVKQQLEAAHLADRKISIPDRAPAASEEPQPDPVPLTIGAMRAFLACRPDLADDLPVVVGGVDFDDPDRKMMGMADVLWSDTQGAFGGRQRHAVVGDHRPTAA